MNLDEAAGWFAYWETVADPEERAAAKALRVERDALRARLAAQQPVIDAAIAWEREPDALDHEANNALMEAAYTYRAALSGSVEAADTPPSGTSGHEADTPAEPEQHRLDVWERDDNDWTWRCTCQVHGASWPSERAAQEAADEHAREVAGTPAAEPAPDDARARRYTVRFDDLFHVPASWLSWRCDLGGSRVDPGYVDGACRYDHNVKSWSQLAAEADEHLARWHPHIRALAGAGAPTEPADDTQETDHG